MSYEVIDKVIARVLVLDQEVRSIYWSIFSSPLGGSVKEKFDRISVLEGIIHSIVVDDSVIELLQDLASKRYSLDLKRVARLRYIDKLSRCSMPLSISLIESLNKARAASLCGWIDANKKRKFQFVEAAFSELLTLLREVAVAQSESFGCSRYDALLSQYEDDVFSGELESYFVEAGKVLRETIGTVVDTQSDSLASVKKTRIKMNHMKQKELWISCAELMGIDKDNLSFIDAERNCSFLCDGIHIGYRRDERSAIFILIGVLFELGYNLFYPNSDCVGDSLRVESTNRSLLVMQGFIFSRLLLSSEDFMHFLHPKLCSILGCKDDEPLLFSDLADIVKGVVPGWDIHKTDILTYQAHLMLRYTIEKALIEGDMQVADIPQAWRDDVQYYLGITIKNDVEGCLSNLDWYLGNFGAVPVHLLGALSGCCVFESLIRREVIDPAALAKGDLKGLVQWLKINIFDESAKDSTLSILKRAMGSVFSVESYSKYLRSLYKL